MSALQILGYVGAALGGMSLAICFSACRVSGRCSREEEMGL